MTLVRKTPLAKPLASAAPGHSCGANLQPLESTQDRGGGGAPHRGRRKLQAEVGGERWPPPSQLSSSWNSLLGAGEVLEGLTGQPGRRGWSRGCAGVKAKGRGRRQRRGAGVGGSGATGHSLLLWSSHRYVLTLEDFRLEDGGSHSKCRGRSWQWRRLEVVLPMGCPRARECCPFSAPASPGGGEDTRTS